MALNPIPGTGSCVIGKSVHLGGGQTDRAQQLLSTFVHHFSETGATKAELKLVSGMSTRTFYRALDDLVKHGELTNIGTDTRPFYKAVSE